MKKKTHIDDYCYMLIKGWMFKKGKFCLVIKDKSFPLGNRLHLFFNKIFGNKMCQT